MSSEDWQLSGTCNGAGYIIDDTVYILKYLNFHVRFKDFFKMILIYLLKHKTVYKPACRIWWSMQYRSDFGAEQE